MTQYTPSSSEPGQRPPNFWNSSRGIASWLLTLDHKRIGVMYLAFVWAAFMLGGVFALLVRTELLTAGKTIVEAATYNQLFTLHGAVMVFLVIIPSIPASRRRSCCRPASTRRGRRSTSSCACPVARRSNRSTSTPSSGRCRRGVR